MHKTVVALYDNLDDAEQTVRDLVDSGLPRDQISLVASDRTGQFGENLSGTGGTSGAAQGAGVGAGIGAALGGIGGLLIGLGALAIPGIGPVLAAGPLAAALGGVAGAGAGAIAGGAAGGLIGGLTDMGVTEQQAGYFAEGVRRGGSLVTVRTDDPQTERAKDVMNRHHPIDVNERAAEWQKSGWTGFSPSGAPMRGDTGQDMNMGTGQMGSSSPMPDTNIGQGSSSGTTYGGGMNDPRTTGGQVPPQTDIPPQGTAMDEDDMGNSGMGAASMGDTGSTTGMNTSLPNATGNTRTGDYSGGMDSGGVVTGPNSTMNVTPGGIQVRDFNFYDMDFRNHYENTFGNRGYTFNQYVPAYRYGYDLANNNQYHNMEWNDVEPDAQRFWEERHPGTWDEFRDAIYHAWSSVHDTSM